MAEMYLIEVMAEILEIHIEYSIISTLRMSLE